MKLKCEKKLFEMYIKLFCGLKLITFWSVQELFPLANCRSITQYVSDNGLRYMYICNCQLGTVIGEQALIEKKKR